MRRARPLTLLATAAVLLATAGPAGAYVIAPGSQGSFTYDQCTLNFVFDGTGEAAGRVYIGTAAHCASGQPREEVRMGGDAIEVGQVIGHVVAVGPYDRSAGQSDTRDDWALIEIVPGHRGEVHPAMLGHPGFPTRVTTSAEMREGDVLQYSGYGTAAQATATTREQRQGQWTSGDERLLSAIAPHITPGDSGGPIVDVKTGGAMGLVSGIFGDCNFPCTMKGPTITSLIAGAAAQGLTVQLRAAGQKAPAPPAAGPPEPAPQPAPRPAPAPAPAKPAAAPVKLKLSAAGRRRCVRAGRIALRLTASVPLQSARLTAPRRQALRLGRPARLRGLRGRRVRLAVTARTRDGRSARARATFRAC